MMPILIFIICLAILIIIHELGHFLVAKKNGIKVEEFGIGLPPRIWGVKKGETIYSINALPFGGFVKIYGENGEHIDEERSFSAKKPGVRAKVLAAGVIMNLIFGIFLLMIGFNIGVPAVVTEKTIPNMKDIKLAVLEVQKDSPAELAGLKMGDYILEVFYNNEDKILNPKVEDLQNFTKKYAGKELNLKIERGKEILEIKAVAREGIEAEEKGALGIVISDTGLLKYSFFRSLWEGLKNGLMMFVNVFISLFIFLKSLIVEGQMIGEVAGPVGIVALGSNIVKNGIGYLLQFLATLSIYLSAINLIPFPALDGARIFSILIEKIRGKAIPAKTENLINSIGFVLLMGLFVFVTFNDIMKLVK
ncbi:MAG TPA: RIP metalloprotease RseP [Candidatus Paceibacterota bacterium]|nr:RIP metalloprotease RseP [Candidatus Paceibacterota bacterium]HPC37297.1 RIP metalloprotease RseP [Candidatus Paceibacterota bacterium]HRU35846.1 RIP metalloprotease RseP [Candidatus Paceibacterota bacterium]